MKSVLRIALATAAMVAMMAIPRAAAAGQSEKFAGFVVYYSALSTDLLPPQVANAYQIQRSSHRGLINVSVRKDATVGSPAAAAVPASVRGTVINLTNQRTSLDFREIRDGDAIYYLSVFPVSGTDTLRFDLTVKPQGGPSHELKFSQDYVVGR